MKALLFRVIRRSCPRILQPALAIAFSSLAAPLHAASPIQTGTAATIQAPVASKSGGGVISGAAPTLVTSSSVTPVKPGPGTPVVPLSTSPAAAPVAPVQPSSNLADTQNEIRRLEQVLKKLNGQSSSANADPLPASIPVGTDVGSAWLGMPQLPEVIVHTEPTLLQGYPSLAKYPNAAGATAGAFTPNLIQEYNLFQKRLPLRSWLGWFVWANGTPPPGLNPGIFNSPAGYGTYSGTGSDFFNFQWPITDGKTNGSWNPIRIDQQPLYLSPLNVSYNWAPALFGYQSRPLKNFPLNTFYWQNKKIVRGVNIAGDIPFFYQYGNKLDFPIPAPWRQSWMYLATRPLESTVVVPSNLTPMQLSSTTALGNWSGTDPFPYPVWSSTVSAKNQTPFALLVDRVGDWDADLVWEATNPGAPNYSSDRYRRTSFSQSGTGNYMKMTVAQGSPLVWCETNNNRYAIFYDLIRTNLAGHIDNTGGAGGTPAESAANGTNAGVVLDGPWKVPGVQGVSFVLLYGDQVNPNQWYQESIPWYGDIGDGPTDSQLPGGFNPPPGPYFPPLPTPTPSPTPAPIQAKGQHNHIYTVIYYRDDTVKPVQIGKFGGKSNGTDAQGNPYFFLEFLETGKNWFVVGQVPEMRYYHSTVTQDPEATRKLAAVNWANTMGKYAFNFPVDTNIKYAVTNMYKATTTYTPVLKNPFVELQNSPRNAAAMTVKGQTVMALNPHQYQPITLGPDLTKSSQPQVVWSPLSAGYGTDFPVPTNLNANKTTSTTPSRYGYWSLRGNLKTIITPGFTTTYPFQNFLPVMPPPNYKKEFVQTGIPAVNIVNTGSGYHRIDDVPAVKIKTAPGIKGQDATAKALVNKNTGVVQQVDVIGKGTEYPNGIPPEGVTVEIDPPTGPGVQAEAYPQVGGNQVLAIFMKNQGAGYASVITAEQPSVTGTIDPPIIVPKFDGNGNMLGGAADVIEGGAGFDFSGTNTPNVQVIGTGTGAVAVAIKPGNLLDVKPVEGGVTDAGRFPASGTLPPNVTVHITPPPGGGPAQSGTAVMVQTPGDFQSAVINRGDYASEPTATILDDSNNPVAVNLNFGGGQVTNVYVKDPVTISSPRDVTFTGSATTPAVARVYPVYTVQGVVLTPPFVRGYNADVEVGFTGGDFSDVPSVTMPDIKFEIPSNGIINSNDIKIVNSGSNIPYQIDFEVFGSRGFDAILLPIVNNAGKIVSVRVLSGGSNYLPQGKVFGFIDNPGHTGPNFASLSVQVSNGVITGVTVDDGGTGYTDATVIKLTSKAPPYGGVPDVVYADNPKGYPARFSAIVQSGTISSINKFGALEGKTEMKYIPGSEGKATTTSLPGLIWWFSNTPFARVTGPSKGYFARPAPEKTIVEQVLYSSIISQYTTLAGKPVAPFGGAFLGESAPDGYGLGGQIGGASKFVGDIYNMQQKYATFPPGTPSRYAIDAAKVPPSAYDLPIYQENNPFVSLSGALQSSVQGMQRTISLLFSNPASHNEPTGDARKTTWKMDYFSQYDAGVGRLVINPTATQPAWGVNSSTNDDNYLNIPNTPEENGSKPDGSLSRWQKGMLWSGFGVSDQWNDQHYFYGYYLGTAALAGLFDRAWQPSITAKPVDSTLWAGESQMGKGIDQLLMTLAYDPDNVALSGTAGYYKDANFKYQKFAYFDQWGGHPWATGSQPGTTVAVLNFAGDPFGFWRSFGTDSDKYNGENENSAFEGLQAWSSAILWGGATDRKSIVDLGIYLYSTNLAAADAYFLDKNYNLANSPNNAYSWVPVSTIDSSQVRKNGGNMDWPADTGYVEANPIAYYEAPEFFGDSSGNKASAGQSLLKKAENTLNNFFYAYPTGSKFIQAYPPAPWTLGMARNSNYMKKWAGAMMRDEWTQARDSALYQPADWNAMALTSALSGVPYNPGDQPYPLTGKTPNAKTVNPYLGRLWSSWVTANQRPGANAALNPPFLATSVLTFLLALEEYGTPDWTYIGKATTAAGAEDANSVVFMAVFSKLVTVSGKPQVQTTFVAFNPGWTTRYARFYRLNLDGTIVSAAVTDALAVAPKKTVVKTINFDVKK